MEIVKINIRKHLSRSNFGRVMTLLAGAFRVSLTITFTGLRHNPKQPLPKRFFPETAKCNCIFFSFFALQPPIKIFAHKTTRAKSDGIIPCHCDTHNFHHNKPVYVLVFPFFSFSKLFLSSIPLAEEESNETVWETCNLNKNRKKRKEN